MRSGIAQLLLPLAAVSVISAQSPSPSPQALAPAVQFVGFGDQLAKTARSKPTCERIRKIKNRHSDGDFDDWCTRDYPGLRIVVVRPLGGSHELVRQVVLKDRSTKLPCGIVFGASPEVVVKVLGQPSSSKPGRLSYEVGDLLSEEATLYFNNGQLIRVDWDYEID